MSGFPALLQCDEWVACRHWELSHVVELEGVSDLLRFPLWLCVLELKSVGVDLSVCSFLEGCFVRFFMLFFPDIWLLAVWLLASGFWFWRLVFGWLVFGFWLLAFGFWIGGFLASGLLVLWFLADRFIDLTAKQMWQDRVVGLTGQNLWQDRFIDLTAKKNGKIGS